MTPHRETINAHNAQADAAEPPRIEGRHVIGIVERLREEALALQQTAWSRMDGGQQCSLNASLAEEAADEIERLTRQIEDMSRADGFHAGYVHGKTVGEARASLARRKAFEEAGQKAREYAAHYPEASDGRNTFIIFAEWAEGRA